MNACRCRMVAMGLATVLSVLGADAQQRDSGPHTATFTAPDGAFRFSFPRDFQVCTKGKIHRVFSPSRSSLFAKNVRWFASSIRRTTSRKRISRLRRFRFEKSFEKKI